MRQQRYKAAIHDFELALKCIPATADAAEKAIFAQLKAAIESPEPAGATR